MTTFDRDPAVRQAFRDFVRRNHPDLGGDPATFSAGLAAYGRGATAKRGAAQGQSPGGRAPPADTPLIFYRRPRGLAAPLAWLRAQLGHQVRRTRAPRVQ